MYSIIVPTLNEAENIAELVQRIDRVLAGRRYEVIIVDDSSADGTAEVAEELAKRYPVRAMKRRSRMGLSSAVVEGARLAQFDIVAVMDADLQHPPELLPRLFEVAERGCLAVASRYVRGGGAAEWPVARRLISKGAVLLARLLLPEARGVRDPVSGYFAYRRECVSAVSPTGRYKILLDVLTQCRPQCVVEVPYVFANRRRGKSKLGVGHVLDYMRQVMTLARWRPLRFAAVGLSGVAVAWGVLYATAALPPPLSVALAVEASITSNYFINRRWTFADRKTPLLRGWARYHLAVSAGALTNYATTLTLALLGVWIYLAYLLGAAAGYLSNYTLSEVFVFKKS
ncbi:MAG: glycosyltransferase [Nanopusillaceae archaeon]